MKLLGKWLTDFSGKGGFLRNSQYFPPNFCVLFPISFILYSVLKLLVFNIVKYLLNTLLPDLLNVLPDLSYYFITMTLMIAVADGSEFTAFLDSGYALGSTFITPFSRRRVLTAAEKSFNRYYWIIKHRMTLYLLNNRRMSSVRQPSEWGIGKVKSLFSYLEYKVVTWILLQHSCLLSHI